MLINYIEAAIRQGKYQLLEDGTFYGEIPRFQGVYADAETLEACKKILQEVLERWIILELRLQNSLPVIDGIDLNSNLVNINKINNKHHQYDPEGKWLCSCQWNRNGIEGSLDGCLNMAANYIQSDIELKQIKKFRSIKQVKEHCLKWGIAYGSYDSDYDNYW